MNLALLLVSTALFLVLVEGLAFVLYGARWVETYASDRVALRGRFPASFRLGEAELALLSNPGDRYVLTTFAATDPTAPDIEQGLSSIEFYMGEQIIRLRTDVSERPPYERFLTDKDDTLIDTLPAFLQRLSTAAQGRGIVITLGGSTTAWAWNWPWNFAVHLEQAWPGRYLVLNLAQPTVVSYQHTRVLRDFALPVLDRHGLAIEAVVAMDGINDATIPLAYHLWAEVFRQFGGAERWGEVWRPAGSFESWSGLDPRERYEPRRADLADLLDRARRLAIRAMPYASTLLARTITPARSAFYSQSHGDEIEALSALDPASGALVYRTDDAVRERIDRFFEIGVRSLLSIADSRSIPVYYFLQPIASPEYYPLVSLRRQYLREHPELPIPYRPSAEDYLRIGSLFALSADVLIEVAPQYRLSEALFRRLGEERGCCFFDLSMMFARLRRLEDDAYGPDAIHYLPWAGSPRIGTAIFEHFRDAHVTSE